MALHNPKEDKKRREKNQMAAPQKAPGTRTRITTKNPPGGPHTPGAKRDKDTVNNSATRAAGTAPAPLVSDVQVREELRLELRRKARK